MTFKSKLPLHLYQTYFQVKENLELFLSKMEVIADSKAIIYSIRILIVVIALLMGYIHTPKKNTDAPRTQKIELHSIPSDIID